MSWLSEEEEVIDPVDFWRFWFLTHKLVTINIVVFQHFVLGFLEELERYEEGLNQNFESIVRLSDQEKCNSMRSWSSNPTLKCDLTFILSQCALTPLSKYPFCRFQYSKIGTPKIFCRRKKFYMIVVPCRIFQFEDVMRNFRRVAAWALGEWVLACLSIKYGDGNLFSISVWSAGLSLNIQDLDIIRLDIYGLTLISWLPQWTLLSIFV